MYGSLRSGFRSPAYEYVSNFFRLVGEAKVKGKLYDLGTYPAAVPTTDNSFIIGELYQIKRTNEFEWAMAQLDDYEGVSGGSTNETQLYCREITDVFMDNKVTQAWIYWFRGDVTGKPVIESGDLMQYLQQKK